MSDILIRKGSRPTHDTGDVFDVYDDGKIPDVSRDSPFYLLRVKGLDKKDLIYLLEEQKELVKDAMVEKSGRYSCISCGAVGQLTAATAKPLCSDPTCRNTSAGFEKWISRRRYFVDIKKLDSKIVDILTSKNECEIDKAEFNPLVMKKA